MKGKILVSLFALPFAAVGTWMLWSVSSNLYDAWRMDDWVQVPAQLLDAGYEHHSGDDADTYEAYARYRYEYAGREHTGERVSIGSGADNIGDYQQDLGRKLQSAFTRGERILVYVDPEAPSAAVVDRGIRWGMVGFKSVFIVVFGGVGFGLLVGAWRAPATKDAADPGSRDKPWLLNDDWQSETIRSSSKSSMWAAWTFAGVWNAISSVGPFLAYREIVDNGNLVGLAILLFPLVGIGLLVWAIRRTLEWRRFGPAPVTLDPFPGSIGGHVGGTIDLRLPFDPAARFRLTLTSIHSYESGSGDDRSRREKARWQDAIVAHAEPGGQGTRLTFRFDVPEGQHESDTEKDDSYYLWRLDLGAELPGTDLDRSYEIPVYATAEHSRRLPRQAVEQARREQAALDDGSVRERVNLSHTAAGRRLYFPMGRHLGASLGGLAAGSMFAGAGWFLAFREGHALFGGVFLAVGALIALMCLYMMLNSLEVLRQGSGLRITRRLLGIPVRQKNLGLDAIRELRKHSSLQTQSGGKHVIFYKIQAVDRLGNTEIVGEGFRGESEANAGIRLMRREFGLRIGTDSGPAADDDLLGPEVLT